MTQKQIKTKILKLLKTKVEKSHKINMLVNIHKDIQKKSKAVIKINKINFYKKIIRIIKNNQLIKIQIKELITIIRVIKNIKVGKTLINPKIGSLIKINIKIITKINIKIEKIGNPKSNKKLRMKK